jgi:hypothetical protein
MSGLYSAPDKYPALNYLRYKKDHIFCKELQFSIMEHYKRALPNSGNLEKY